MTGSSRPNVAPAYYGQPYAQPVVYQEPMATRPVVRTRQVTAPPRERVVYTPSREDVRREPDRSWRITSAVGSALPRSPDEGEAIHLDADHVLVLTPPGLSADDRRVLGAFAGQLAAALEQRELRERAAVAEARAEVDQLRTAILRAVKDAWLALEGNASPRLAIEHVLLTVGERAA